MSESLASLLQPELKKGSATLRQQGNKLTLAFATAELFPTGDAAVTLGGSFVARTDRSRPARISLPEHRGCRPYRQRAAPERPSEGLSG